MNLNLKMSLSPHIHSGNSVKKEMYGVIWALVPVWLVSIYFFGVDALRVTLISVLACLAFEWLIQKFLNKTESTLWDGSAGVTGILLAFNLPSNLPTWMIIVGAFVAIAIAKMSFGGLGQNPFNPALVARVFMLISFPVQMTSWPVPDALNFSMVDAQTGATALGIMKEGLKNGEPMSELMNHIPGTFDMLLGRMGGSMGEVSALALILGGLFMWWRKIITWHIPVSIIATIALFTGILHALNPGQYATPSFHILAGGALLGAIFMATDMVTSPMSKKGMLVFGIGIGLITVIIRVFGAYPEGISFAILIMNAFVPLINKYLKPNRFGKEVKNG